MHKVYMKRQDEYHHNQHHNWHTVVAEQSDKQNMEYEDSIIAGDHSDRGSGYVDLC